MIDLSLFTRPAFVGAQVTAFAISSTLFAMFLYITLYLQNILGLSPLQTGVRFLPLSLLAFFVAPVAGRLSTRLPIRALLGAGLALCAHLDVPDEPRHRPFDLARRCCRASSSAASGSAWSTRRSPRPPSRPCGSSARGWPPGSTTRSGRSASPPASRRSARSSRTRCTRKVVYGARRAARTRARSRIRSRTGSRPRRSPPRPPGSAAHLTEVAKASFVSGFHEILIVGAIVALCGAVLAARADPPAGLRREPAAGRRAGRPPRAA